MIFAGVNGYLDNVPVGKVTEYESGLLRLMRSQNKDILDAIGREKQLSDDLREKLKSTVEVFTKAFATEEPQKAA